MSEPIDVSKIRVGDTVHFSYKVKHVYPSDKLRPVYIEGRGWSSYDHLTGHTPRALQVGDAVNSISDAATIAAIFIEDDTACLKLHESGAYVIRTLSRLKRREEPQS